MLNNSTDDSTDEDNDRNDSALLADFGSRWSMTPKAAAFSLIVAMARYDLVTKSQRGLKAHVTDLPRGLLQHQEEQGQPTATEAQQHIARLKVPPVSSEGCPDRLMLQRHSLRNQMSGVGIVWRVAHSKGIPNDILVDDADAVELGSFSLLCIRLWMPSILLAAPRRPTSAQGTSSFKWMDRR